MNNIKYKLISFMQGRYGPDKLYRTTVIAAIVLCIINLFARLTVISLISWGLIIWGLFRCLSKNIAKRSSENYRYIKLEEKILKKAGMTRTMLTDKEHYYKKCSQCKNVLRLPRIKGSHSTVCPKCGNKLQMRIR